MEQMLDIAAQEEKLLAELDELGSSNEEARAALAERKVLFEKDKDVENTDGVLSDIKAQEATLRIERISVIDAKLAHLSRQKREEDRRKPVPEAKQSALSRAVRAVINEKPLSAALEDWEIKRHTGRKLEETEARGKGAILAFDLYADLSQGEREAAVPASDVANAHDTLPKVAIPRVTHDLEYSGYVAATVSQRVTATGVDMAFPHRSANAEGKILTAQGTAVGPIGTEDPGEFEAIVFKALTSHSDRLALQLELVEDSGIDLRGEMMGEGMSRLDRAWNSAEVTRPAALNDKMQAMKQMSEGRSVDITKGAVTYDDFVDLTYAIDEGYVQGNDGLPNGWMQDANGGMLGFLLHRSMVQQAQKLKDTANRQIWQPAYIAGLASGRGGRILDFDYRINQKLDDGSAAAAQNNVPGLFYNGGFFRERRVGVPRVYVFMGSPEIEKNQVVYLIVQRRFFGPIGALSAGDGVNDATRSNAIGRFQVS